jgi:alkaline phosphatase
MAAENFQGDRNAQPYTTLGYANGTGHRGGAKRPDLTHEQVTNPNFKQEATVPMTSETHGGEDVAIFATGAGAYLVRGSMEENWIFFVMKEAMRLK